MRSIPVPATLHENRARIVKVVKMANALLRAGAHSGITKSITPEQFTMAERLAMVKQASDTTRAMVRDLLALDLPPMPPGVRIEFAADMEACEECGGVIAGRVGRKFDDGGVLCQTCYGRASVEG